jgi:pimeloyl-ACP methyl ester carboxylesterase
MDGSGVARRGGAQLYWESTGTGPPVLLIAGLGLSAAFWWRTVPVLSRRWRVVTFDNRGVGRSSPPAWLSTTEDMAADAVAVLDAAGIDAAHVYGFSLGGMVAQQLASRHPRRVASLVLGATHPGSLRAVSGDGDVVAFFRRRTRLPADEAAWASVPYNYSERCRREHPERIAEDIARRLRLPTSPRTFRAQLGAGLLHNCIDRLSSITAPTLVVHGTEDRMVPVANGELLAARIPDVRLHLLPGVGHMYASEEPAADEAIGDFLAELAPVPA